VKSVAQLVTVSVAILLAARFDGKLNMKLLVALSGALLAVVVPNYLLKSKIAARRNAIRDELPCVMDLLVVSVEAGLGFDGAILQLYEKRRKSPLMQEIVLPVRDVQMGLSRRSALKNMGERNEVPELKILAGSLIQAEQLGVSIKSVLVALREQLRVDRSSGSRPSDEGAGKNDAADGCLYFSGYVHHPACARRDENH
jgi:tight adherence protein C